MASARSLNLVMGPSPPQEKIIQLGSLIQRRGVEEVDEVLYPRFTGVGKEFAGDAFAPIDEIPVYVTPGDESVTMFMSEDIQSLEPVNSIVFPQPGMYRIRFQANYRWRNQVPETQLRFSTVLGSTTTDYTVVSRETPGVDGILVTVDLVFDQIIQCQSVGNAFFDRGGVGSALTPRYTFTAQYLGSL